MYQDAIGLSKQYGIVKSSQSIGVGNEVIAALLEKLASAVRMAMTASASVVLNASGEERKYHFPRRIFPSKPSLSAHASHQS
eukprot:5276641-Amphidinium_carterae.1